MHSSPGGVHPRYIIIAVIILVIIGVASFYKHSKTNSVVTEVPTEESNTVESQSDTDRAQSVLTKLRQHMDIANTPEPTVAAIVDVEKLRQRNSFYDKAENGDYLVVTPNRAILFDFDENIIRDVVPVELDAPVEAAEE